MVHDAFVAALCKPISERPPLEDRKALTAWLCSFAEYAAKTNLKPKQRRTYLALTPTGELEERPDTADIAAIVEWQVPLRRAMAGLSAEQCTLVAAHVIDEQSFRDIADAEQQARSTVSDRYGVAMAKLRLSIDSMETRSRRRGIWGIPIAFLGSMIGTARAYVRMAWVFLLQWFRWPSMRLVAGSAMGLAALTVIVPQTRTFAAVLPFAASRQYLAAAPQGLRSEVKSATFVLLPPLHLTQSPAVVPVHSSPRNATRADGAFDRRVWACASALRHGKRCTK